MARAIEGLAAQRRRGPAERRARRAGGRAPAPVRRRLAVRTATRPATPTGWAPPLRNLAYVVLVGPDGRVLASSDPAGAAFAPPERDALDRPGRPGPARRARPGRPASCSAPATAPRRWPPTRSPTSGAAPSGAVVVAESALAPASGALGFWRPLLFFGAATVAVLAAASLFALALRQRARLLPGAAAGRAARAARPGGRSAGRRRPELPRRRGAGRRGGPARAAVQRHGRRPRAVAARAAGRARPRRRAPRRPAAARRQRVPRAAHARRDPARLRRVRAPARRRARPPRCAPTWRRWSRRSRGCSG